MPHKTSKQFKQLVCLFLFVFLISMATTSTAFGGGYKKILDDFFAHFEKGEVVEAVDGLYGTNKWTDAQSDDIKGLKSDINSMQSMVGDYLGKKRIGVEVYEDFLAHFTYAVLYERQPVIMDFTFYKSGDKWVIYNYTFGADMDEKLKEKVYSQMME